ncbi:MAG: amidohydrolase family protein [FCB group bacterium]|nr:amidohydrolase family protein [FCB group bacterium]
MKKLICCLFYSALLASGQIPGADPGHPILLKGGILHTVSQGTFTGDLLFENGKITAIAPEIRTTGGYEVQDVSDRHIYPGLISAGSTIGLVEIGAVRATRDANEVGQIKASVHTERAYNPDSEEIPVTRSNGVLLVQVIPQGGLVSGTSAVMMMDGWSPEDCTLRSDVGVHVNWPAMRINKAWWEKRTPEEQQKATNKNLQKLEDLLKDVRAYAAAKAAGTQKGTDANLEAMLPVLSKEIPVYVHANRLAQIEAAVNWSLKEDLRMVLVGGGDSWRVTDLLKANNIPVICQNPLSMPLRRWGKYDEKFTLPAKLSAAGVSFCITTSNTYSNQRNLPYEASMAAAFGLSRDEALRAITLSTAEILDIANRAGSLEVGKDATLFIADGDILEIPTRVTQAFIQGRPVDLEDKQKKLRDKYTEKYRRLGIYGSGK